MRHRHSDHHPGHSGMGQRFARRLSEQARERRHHHRGGGLGRFLEHGDLRLLVLHLVGEKPRHGYDIIKAIEEKAGGAYSPSPGVVYPTLTLLEELGHISVTPGEGPRKLHAITAEGEAYLAANREALDAILARFDAAGVEGGGRAPPIMRAMMNLRVALKLRLARGPLDAEQVRAIAAALDEAAAAIERA